MGITYLNDCYISGRLLHILVMRSTYLDDWMTFGRGGYRSRWLLHILTTRVRYLDENICGWLLHIGTKSVTYLDDCYIAGWWVLTYLDDCYMSGRRVLHIWTTVTYLNNECYIFGRLLHIWMTSVVYLGDCYISGDICLNIIDVRWQPHLRGTTDLCRANSSLSSTMNDSKYLYYLVSINARKFKYVYVSSYQFST